MRHLTAYQPFLFLTLLGATVLPLLLAGCNEDDVERSIGRQTATAVEKEYGVNTDPVLQDWASTLGHRVVGQSRRQNIAYSFKVINTDMVNAFAAPWGYVYLTRGFLDFSQSEDEVAFVLSHEVGHVTNRDSIKSMKKNILFNIGAALLGSQSETLGSIGGLGAGLLLLHYSREDERDADIAGAMYSYNAGYDPQGGIEFFTRLYTEVEKGEEASSLEHLFLTHPATLSRVQATKQRPELNLDDPAVASHIGRTYARRSAFATAGTYYKRALTKKPEAITTRLTYAEALARQGFYDRAKVEYQTVLQRDPGNAFANTGLQALNTDRPQLLPGSPADQQLAQNSLPLLTTVDRESSTAVKTASDYRNAMNRPTATNASMVKGSIASLMEISSRNKEMSDRSNAAFVNGNGAVSMANDSAFTIESVNDDIARVSGLLQANGGALATALKRSAAGQEQYGDAARYQRALIETRLGHQQIADAVSTARGAMAEVQKATRLARTTVDAMGTMVNSNTPDRYIYNVKEAAGATRQQAKQASEKIGQAKRMTAIAESRALLAKLNLAAAGASPETRRIYDGLVGYYCNAVPEQVSALRNQGLGFGDAAFVLMAARSSRAPAGNFVGIVGTNQVIDGLKQRGYRFQGPLPLLRFLSRALDREVAARTQG